MYKNKNTLWLINSYFTTIFRAVESSRITWINLFCKLHGFTYKCIITNNIVYCT